VRRAAGGAAIYGVVKADAYGHGAPAVGLELERLGIDGLAVARTSEVEELRHAGCRGRVLLFGGFEQPEELDRVIRSHATPVLTRLEQVPTWSSWLRSRSPDGPPLGIVVEVDTGMSRSGLALAEWPTALRRLRAGSALRLEGLMSHLAESEVQGSGFTARQERRFAAAADLLDADERRSVWTHLANSSAALRRASTDWRAVRTGGALYGLDLRAAEPGAPPSRLQPVMSLHASLLDVRRVPAGAGVGYRRTWRAARDAAVGLVGVGYGDGFSTGLAGCEVLVRGVRCPIVGRISMDSLSVDVSGLPGPAPGDPCVLLGTQGSESIHVAELAAHARIAPYEVWCGLNRRLPRRVIRQRTGSRPVTRRKASR